MARQLTFCGCFTISEACVALHRLDCADTRGQGVAAVYVAPQMVLVSGVEGDHTLLPALHGHHGSTQKSTAVSSLGTSAVAHVRISVLCSWHCLLLFIDAVFEFLCDVCVGSSSRLPLCTKPSCSCSPGRPALPASPVTAHPKPAGCPAAQSADTCHTQPHTPRQQHEQQLVLPSCTDLLPYAPLSRSA